MANVRQIVLKRIGCDPKEAVKQSKTVFMCQILGELIDTKNVEQKDGGIGYKLLGNFRATNSKGEQFDSDVCFLPKFLTEKLMAELKATPSGVQFAFNISSMPDDKSSTGFVWTADPLIKSAGVDRLNELAAKVAAATAKEEKQEAAAGGKKGK